MGPILKQARRKVGMTLREAGYRLGFSERHIRHLEAGTRPIDANTIVRAADLYDAPHLTVHFCRQACSIGRRYCYEPLTNIDDSPVAILTKYRDEKREADAVLDQMFSAILNKRDGDEMTDSERATFERAFQELLDVEHVIEVLQLAAVGFVDVPAAIKAHNQKCWDQGYVKRSMEVAA